MLNIKLSPRLQCIADLVLPGAALADVGTDHAHLPLYLLQHARVRHAVASDLREGPLTRARENAQACGLFAQIELRLAAGLDAIAPNECNTISMAGMGGETIAEILAAAPWTCVGAHRLLLQPMTRCAELRRFLWARGYEIYEEHICREEHRLYVVVCAVGGGESTTAPLPLSACMLSPALLRDPQAGEYLSAQLRREARVLQGMERGTAEGEDMAERRNTVQALKTALEGL